MVLENLNLEGGLPSLNLGGLLSGTAGVLNTILLIAIIGTIFYFVWMIFFGYNKSVLIFRRTASGIRVYKDRGKLRKKQGVTGLHLLWRKYFLPQPKDEQTFMIGRKELILYEWKTSEQLMPVKFGFRRWSAEKIEKLKEQMENFSELTYEPEPENSELQTIPSEIMLWGSVASRSKVESYRKQPIWERLLPLIGIGIAAAVFMITVILILDKFEVLNNVASQLTQTAEIIAKAGTQQIQTTPP